MARRTFKSKHRTMKKKLKLCLFVFLIFVTYLVIGSVIFSAIEKDNEIEVTLRLSEELNSFLDTHTCVNESELMEVILGIRKAIDDGAYDVTFSNTTEEADLIWDTISGIFFCFTIVTTIGFGHISPKTTGGQVFCIVYASIGIPITGYLLSLLGDNFERFWKWYQRLFAKKFKCIRSERLRRATIILFGAVPVLLITLFLPSYYWTWEEEWSYWTSIYYTFITMTTIGFGDIVASIDNDDTPVLNRIFDLILSIFTILLALGILTGILKIASRRIQSKSIGNSRLSTMMKKLIGNETMINKDDKEGNIRTISKEVIESRTNGNHNYLRPNIYREERTATAKVEDAIDSCEQITHAENAKRRTSEISQATDLSCEDVSVHFSNRLELYINKELVISKDGLSDEMITNIRDVVKNHILEATKASGNSNSSIKNQTAVNGTLNRAFVDDTQDTYVHVDMHADVTR